MPRAVVFQLTNGMASSLAIAIDVLATANAIQRRAGRAEPFVVHTLKLTRTTRFSFRSDDVVIVPGINAESAADLIGRLQSPSVQRALQLVRNARAAGATVVASCGGTFVLAEAGLLTKRRATTTWWLAADFRKRYPDVELIAEQIVVADWPVATAGAAMAQMDLMLAVVAKFAGPKLSQICAQYLLLDHRTSQAPYMAITFLAGQDPQIARAESWIRKNIDRRITIEQLATAAGMTPRTFARRLKTVCDLSPVRFAQRIRSEVARTLFETTRLSVDEISRRVGYAEPSTLRRLLRRDLSPPPSRLRQQVNARG
jgi:transcriptional regulator GlxA family with amidase domain